MQGVDALRAEAGDGGEDSKRRGRARFHLLKRLKAAGSGNLLDFAGQVCADPRQRGEVFACRYHPGRTSGQIVDYLRGTAIGANAEGVCALDLKQIGKPSEKFRYVSIMNSHMFMEAYLFARGFDYHQVLEKKERYHN